MSPAAGRVSSLTPIASQSAPARTVLTGSFPAVHGATAGEPLQLGLV